MPVEIIPIDLRLPSSRLIDVVLVQWHTPTPAGVGAAIPNPHRQRREQELGRLSAWLTHGYECGETDRPLFVLFPELSLPRDLTAQMDALFEGLERPTIGIGGLEYLSKAEFEELGGALNLVIPLDDLVGSLNNGTVVNTAAVWIKEPGQPVRHFLQPKNHPYEDEAPQISCGNLLGLFESVEQGKGARFNFTVHVCADFAAEQRVQQMLVECEQAKPGAVLDAAFVIQHNADQTASQFRAGARAYYAPPPEGETAADTAGASIIMINNASERVQRRGHWGDSQFKYNWEKKVRLERLRAPDTYFLHDDAAYGT